MPNSTIEKNSFTLGEISPRTLGRFDESKPIFRDGVSILENFLILQHGPTFYRPGTQYVATAGQVAPVRLDTFQYSLLQEYVLEFGNQYLQFYANSGQLMSGGNPVNIATPYLQADLFQLQLANKNDVCYIAHKNYPPYKLIRTSATSFLIQQVQFIGGPFRDSNVGNVTLTASAATGTITLTATIPAWLTATQYLPGDYVTNGGTTYLCQLTHTSGTFATDLAAGNWIVQNFFVAGHLGSLWSVGAGTTGPPIEPAGTFVCTGVTSSTVLAGYVQVNPDGTAGNISTTSATTVWAEGAWSTYRGWPVSVCFHEGRLVFGGNVSQPQTGWASAVGSYEDFSPGSASDDDAWNFTSTQGDAIQWMKSMMYNSGTALRMGTLGGCLVWVDGSTSGITPSSPPTIIMGPDYQVQYTQPKAISSYAYYMQGNSYQLRQLIYDYLTGTDKSEDMTLLADHILRDGGGVSKIARQESPNDRLWCVRNDNQIAVLTRNVEQQIMAWCRIIPGSTSGGAGIFNDIAITPVQGNDDQVWVSVNRMVNGSLVQFIEIFTSEIFQNPWEPCRLDASLSINNPITITGMTNANPCVVTAPGHGLSNGQRIRIDNVTGMNYTTTNPVSGLPQTTSINGFPYLIVYIDANTFSLTNELGVAINSTSYTAFQTGANGPSTTPQVRAMNTTFSGLSYLNGETVSVTADGGLPAAQQTFVVSGGSITLPNPAAVVHIGLPYTGTIRFLPMGENSGHGTSQTKMRKIFKVVARVWNSLGATFGDNLNNMFKQIYSTQNPNAIPGYSPPLYTGDIELDFESFFSNNWQPYLVQNQPLPYMLLALVIDSDVQVGKSE